MSTRRPKKAAAPMGAKWNWNDIPKEYIVGTIDLHGQTKEKAISLMTAFLSQVLTSHSLKQCSSEFGVWVLVITGSGKHSQHGAVLRNAVKATLEKRHMTHILNANGKGSFLVRADSGFELYGPSHELRFDTKVVTVSDEEGKLQQLNRSRRNGGGARGSHFTNLPRNDSRTKLSGSTNPLPREVAASDSAVAAAKKAKCRDALKARRDVPSKDFNEDELELVLKLSMDQAKRESARVEEETTRAEQELAEALRESRFLEEAEEKKAEAELDQVMQLSLLQREDDEFRRRLAARVEHSCDHEEKDDSLAELEKAIQLSVNVSQMTEEDIMKLAIEESRREEAIRKSLIHSLERVDLERDVI